MENKKYPIGGFAPGYYHCKCFVCAERFQGDKRATMCEPCAIELAARPKEVADHIGEINGMVNQPVQQEEYNADDLCENFQSVQPSTPIVEEQREETDYYESELQKYLDYGIEYTANSIRNAEVDDVQQLVADSFFAGWNAKSLSPNREEGRELQPEILRLLLDFRKEIISDNEFLFGTVNDIRQWAQSQLSPSSTPLEQKDLKDITEEDALLVGETIFETKEIQLKTNNSLAARVTFNDYELEICKRSSWIVLRRKAFIGMEQLPIKPLLLHKAYRYLSQKYKL